MIAEQQSNEVVSDEESFRLAGEDRLRQTGAAGAQVVSGLYRIVKGCTFFETTNKVTDVQSTSLANDVRQYCAMASAESVTITFTHDTVFVDNQLFRSSRDAYLLAIELADILKAREINEVTLLQHVQASEIEEFARLLTKAMRHPESAEQLMTHTFRGIKVSQRNVDLDNEADQKASSPAAKAARLYATAVIAVRALYKDFRAGKYDVSTRIKRVATRIVMQLERNPTELIALAVSMRTTDVAQQAVSAAILGTAMVMQLTDSRAEATTMAVTSMLQHVGRLRTLRKGTIDRALSDAEQDKLAANSTVAIVTLGKIYPAARMWTAISFEAIWRTRSHQLGPVYRGRRTPLILSRVLMIARTFVELLATKLETKPLSPEEALQSMLTRASDLMERKLVRLMIGTLGIFPAGTLVELTTKEIAVVMSVSEQPIHYTQPKIRIIYDHLGAVLPVPMDVNLAAQTGKKQRYIRCLFSASKQQEALLQKYVQEARSRAVVKPWIEGPTEASDSAGGPPPSSASAAAAPAASERRIPPPSSARMVAAPPVITEARPPQGPRVAKEGTLVSEADERNQSRPAREVLIEPTRVPSASAASDRSAPASPVVTPARSAPDSATVLVPSSLSGPDASTVVPSSARRQLDDEPTSVPHAAVAAPPAQSSPAAGAPPVSSRSVHDESTLMAPSSRSLAALETARAEESAATERETAPPPVSSPHEESTVMASSSKRGEDESTLVARVARIALIEQAVMEEAAAATEQNPEAEKAAAEAVDDLFASILDEDGKL